MAQVDMRYPQIAKYTNTSGAETYSLGMAAGKAMSGNVQLEYDDASLYADGAKAEGTKSIIGGKVSLMVDRLSMQALALIGGHTYSAATTGETPTPAKISVKTSDTPPDVGYGFVDIAEEDKVKKYYAIIFPRISFASPNAQYKTRGKSKEYQSPTIEGEMLPDVDEEVYVKTEHASAAAALTYIKSFLSIT